MEGNSETVVSSAEMSRDEAAALLRKHGLKPEYAALVMARPGHEDLDEWIKDVNRAVRVLHPDVR